LRALIILASLVSPDAVPVHDHFLLGVVVLAVDVVLKLEVLPADSLVAPVPYLESFQPIAVHSVTLVPVAPEVGWLVATHLAAEDELDICRLAALPRLLGQCVEIRLHFVLIRRNGNNLRSCNSDGEHCLLLVDGAGINIAARAPQLLR